jgi:hypothetical protein
LQSQSLTLLEGFLKSTLHIESSFRIIVSLSFKKSRESSNGLLELDEFTFTTGEDLTHEEGLG